MTDRIKLFLALLAVILTMAYLWIDTRPAPIKEANWSDVEAEAEQGAYRLIKTQTLWERYRQNPDRLLLVDTRQEWEYRTGHIKGALNFPIEPTWLSRWRLKDELEGLLGPDRNRFIVFY